jgi:hypothetical protein
MAEPRCYETILYREEGPVGILTLNRPEDGNKFTTQTCFEVRDCIESSALAATTTPPTKPRSTPARRPRWRCTKPSSACKSQ